MKFDVEIGIVASLFDAFGPYLKLILDGDPSHDRHSMQSSSNLESDFHYYVLRCCVLALFFMFSL